MTIIVTLQINMLLHSMKTTHAVFLHPTVLVWLIVWLAGGIRDLNAVL
jgi:hypothetical protein